MDDNFYLALVDKFEKSSITDLEFSVGKIRLILRKNGAGKGEPTPETKNSRFPNMLRREAAKASSSESTLSQDEVNKILAGGISHKKDETHQEAPALTITSPIVATFYASPGPDSPPFVRKGEKIKKGQTLCVLEAMKMMNHLEAEYDCEILDVKASSGDLVEFAQVLFEVKKI
ncbi:MAG: acetyl-CoA carboxylase biotin carboxyl carrier protein subunit [Spirochaetaceae bacterium]|jgi:acetyl-CoA carboxylase biotin carboxyl carrier protein|nr:acetyl-CoA carboxylase biotin carboxyl carrier protein subunit [Spirochaetaceae bacterium]